MTHQIYLGLGSNLGNRLASLQQALQAMQPEIEVLRTSQVYETPPWGYTDQPAFLNQAAAAQTELDPQALLAKLKSIEKEMGRTPNFLYGPRSIDLDVLFYDDLVYQSDNLTIPHPSLPERAFVLVPLHEIAPDLIHPGSHQSISELLKNVDAQGISIFAENQKSTHQPAWGKRTYVMGIINITPDSFSGDGILGCDDPVKKALETAKQFVEEGADILDLGAESSRPGSESISTDEEIRRLLPVIDAITSADLKTILSIDTYKSGTARECLRHGAHWINDIWALKADPQLAGVIADFKATVVLMHNRSRSHAIQHLGNLGSSYQGSGYANLIEDIQKDLLESISLANTAGLRDDQIILDPGIGFGKSVEQNLEIINHLDVFKKMGFPILIGPSRKSFIGQILNLPVEEREEGTAAAVAIGIMRGADIIRVHNVHAMTRVARMCDAIVHH